MGENAFITLSERPPGPPPPPPIPQGGGRMPAPPGMAHQHMHPHHQAPGPSLHPPPPPRDILPLELRLPPQTRLSDLSQELITDDDIRQRCTEYVAFRLEKVFEDQFINRDEPIKSAWEKAVVSQIPGMSKKDLEKEIRRLDRDTVSLPEKKKSMSPVLQRQLDRAMNELARMEPDPVNFQWTLEQVDHQLQEINRGVAMTRERVPLDKRDSNKYKRSLSSTKKDKRKDKKYYERVSVTAYFKRSPREGVNIRVLFEMIQNAQAQALAQRGRQHVGGMPVAMHNSAPPLPVGGGGLAGPRPARGAPLPGRAGGGLPAGAGPPLLPPPPPHLRPPHGGQGGRPGVVVLPQNSGAKGGRKHNDSHGSHSGSESDESSLSDGESVFSTSATQTTSSDSRTSRSSMLDRHAHRRSRSRHRSQSRNRRRSWSREDSRLFGQVPRSHTKHEQRYNLENSPRLPAAPPPPLPLIVQTTPAVVDLERVRDEAYLEGRNDERANALVLEQRSRLPPPRSPPRGLPPPRTGVRLIPARSSRYLEDDLSVAVDGLSLDDGYETEYRHYNQPLRRTFEYDDHSDSLDSYEFAREVPYDRVGRRASEYMQRREAPQIYHRGDRGRERNPFSPMLRRAHTYDSGHGPGY